MIDYATVKVGDTLQITGRGAPGFARLGDYVTVEKTNGTNRVDVVHAVTGEKAYFALTCGAERLEPATPRPSVLPAGTPVGEVTTGS